MMASSSEILNIKQLTRIGSTSSHGTVTTGESSSGGRTVINNTPLNTSTTISTGKTMTERWFLCSQTARTEARLLAILDLITSMLYLSIFGLLSYAIVHHPNLVRKYLEEVPENQDIERLLTYGRAKQAFFLSVLILRPAASLFIALLLFIGAQRRSFGMVRMCFIISIIYITVDMILFIPKTIYTQNGKIYVITYLFNVVYMLYELWVTYELKKEIVEWKEKQDSEGEPETEDTTVAGDGESGGGDE